MFAPRQDYHKPHLPQHLERRYGFKKSLEAVKSAVPIIDEADLLCGPGGLRKVGERWLGRCPLPTHEETTPSFTVYPDDNHFHCYGCGAHGDVLDLHQLAHGFGEDEKWWALVSLARERGVELPRRPQRWHDWQKTKHDIRDVAEEAKVVRRERMFKCLVLTGPEFQIEDEAQRSAAVEQAWRIFENGMKRIGQ